MTADSAPATVLGLGIVGAGGFAEFVCSAAADLPDVAIAAVTNQGRAEKLAGACTADTAADLAALLADSRVGAVVIATPPHTHAQLTVQALAAGRHVFCEKPVALTTADAQQVRDAVAVSGVTYVVDHVLRYNPILAALARLTDQQLLGPVQRFTFDNDAADEDLPPEHWFWDDNISGGIFLEHGVHFFDAAAMLIGAAPLHVQAIGSSRPDGRTDTVVCTVAHAGGALATHAHGFSHPHRAERQLMRIDYGLAEARIHGWIPLRCDLDIWADDDAATAYADLPARTAELLHVPGARPSARAQITCTIDRNAAPAHLTTRDAAHQAPHHITARLDLGGPDTKQAVYRESVRAALLDLATSARNGTTPAADIHAGLAAVSLAEAATQSLHNRTRQPITTPTRWAAAQIRSEP